ncbi:uncharacterized protein [Periplaneta americana]|uniref:uncharacterized protein isoform X2 n=1 Tax=Periplaneta americana TaxID=6978 RepID=UPI0037E93467
MQNMKNDALFAEGSITAALNYCRNPTGDPRGPYCFVQSNDTNGMRQEYCHPRRCQSSECRMAGTGNDYIGELNVTRSNRVCQSWLMNTPHKVDKKYMNETLYPERSVEKARNYCRDPSRNIAGSWCYTTDPVLPTDVCDVRDCVKPEECTMLTRGVGIGRNVYIRNKWRKEGLKFWLKEWDPDLTDGIMFVIRPLNGSNYYKLIIGADDNEKVQLFYGVNDGKKEILLKQKTLPHLIPIGKWGGFWLRVPTGRVSLGYEGLDNYLFDWQHGNVSLTGEQKHELFKPMFITYTSVKGHTIGVNFPCNECHTEKTSTHRFTKILSLGLWSKEPGSRYNNFTLYIRGTGVAVIPLLKLPGLGDYYGLTIGDAVKRMYFIRQEGKNLKTITYVKIDEPMIYTDKWTIFFISYNETNIFVKRNGQNLLQWKHNEPMIFYWFSLGAEKGEITWSFNCEPEDIDGGPRNGGWSSWSPWTCSVTCGGGEGVQTRTCTNPVPNVYGEDCIGEEKLEDTSEYLRDTLQRTHQSLYATEGDKIELTCRQEAVSKVLNEAPTSTIKWALNGLHINPDKKRILLKNNSNLVIKRTEYHDSGVYTCMAVQLSGSRTVITVLSLAVKPKKPTISTRETKKITIQCHGEVLSYIYKDLIQKWKVNGVVWKDYGLTTLAAVNTEEIDYIKSSYAGEWKCVIEQPDLKFEWTTNWLLVEVKHAPNFLTYLMEDPLPAPLFKHFGSERLVLAFLIGFLLFTVALVAGGTFIYLRWCRLP